MIVSRRFFALGGLALFAGCNSLPPDPEGATLPITMADVFAGRAAGGGHFRLKHVHTEWRFLVRVNGRQQGDTLVSDVDYVYPDGSGHRFAWVFRRDPAGQWSGQHPGLSGSTEITELGHSIRMHHVSDVLGPQGPERLGFADVIYRRADRHVVIDSIVSRGGTPTANMRIVLARGR